MKNIVLTISVLLCFNSFSQSDSIQKVKLNEGGASFNFTLKQRELIVVPYLSLGYKKHSTQLGPVVSILQEKESNISINGIQFRYAYNAFSLRKNIDIHLQSTIVYQLSKEEGTGRYFDLSSSSFKPFTFERSSNDFEIYGGYNVIWSLSNRLNIQQSTSYGLIRNKQQSKTDFSTQNITQHSGSFNFSIGVGYRL